MTRALKHLPKVSVLLILIALVIAAPLLERFGITENILAAAVVTVGFAGLLIHRALVLRKPLDGADILLAAPVCVVVVLVVLKETGVLNLPTTAIWVGFAVLTFFALGYVSPPDNRSDPAR